MTDDNNGKLTDPRPALPHNWLQDQEFIDFDEYDKTYAFQIVQNLDGLSPEKGQKLLNFLAVQKGFAV